MNTPIRASALIVFLCLHFPAVAAVPTPRTTVPLDFYQVIIDNNLFHSLGWTKPKSNPTFELIATVIKQNGKHKAFIRNTKRRKVYYVAVDAELGAGVAVEKIESQSVTLKENGKSKVYRLPL